MKQIPPNFHLKRNAKEQALPSPKLLASHDLAALPNERTFGSLLLKDAALPNERTSGRLFLKDATLPNERASRGLLLEAAGRVGLVVRRHVHHCVWFLRSSRLCGGVGCRVVV